MDPNKSDDKPDNKQDNKIIQCYVIRKTRDGQYLKQVVLPRSVDGEGCKWVDNVGEAMVMTDIAIATVISGLWNITQSLYCSPVRANVEINKAGNVVNIVLDTSDFAVAERVNFTTPNNNRILN